MNIGDKVIITRGPYEGRPGVIKTRRGDGAYEVTLEATSYAPGGNTMVAPKHLKTIE